MVRDDGEDVDRQEDTDGCDDRSRRTCDQVANEGYRYDHWTG